MALIKYNSMKPFFPASFSDFFNQDVEAFLNKDYAHVPAVNIKETENEHIVEVSAAGYGKDQFNVEVEENRLTISAEQKETTEDSKEKYARREFYATSFKRSFTLPKNIDTENISAKYEDGILRLTLPKAAEVINKKKVDIV